MANLPPPPPPAQNQAKSGIELSFGSGHKPPVAPNGPSLNQMHEYGRRIRLVEEGLMNLRRKSELNEENNLREFKYTKNQTDILYDEIKAIKSEIKKMKEDMMKMIQEMQTTAKKEDVKKLEKYINIWNPIKFVTQEEVSSIVSHELRKIVREQKAVLKTNQSVPVTQTLNPTLAPTDETPEEIEEDVQEVAKSPTPEQKKMISDLINNHPDIHDMILNAPETFAQKITEDHRLQALFENVDILELSKKMKAHHAAESAYAEKKTDFKKKSLNDHLDE